MEKDFDIHNHALKNIYEYGFQAAVQGM